MRSLHYAASLGLVVLATAAQAQAIVNGNFATGDLTGFTTFTIASGTSGPGLPVVTTFDVTGAGATNAALFEAGKTSGASGGGGLFQNVNIPVPSTGVFAADYAANNTGNADGGTFELLIDNNVVTSFSAGGSPGISRGHLSFSTPLTAGPHQFAVAATRTFFSSSAADQYFTNVSLVTAATSTTPEPGAIAMFGAAGLSGVALLRRRRRK